MANIGIDLGTTNSVVAYLRGGAEVISIRGRPLLPSAVAWDEGEFHVGYGAKSLALSIPENVVISPKRHIGSDKKYILGGKTYTPIDISAMVLAEIKKHSEQFLNEPIESAIVTVPARFDQHQMDDTKKAIEQSGLRLAKLLQEPIAAAATFEGSGEERVLVFDMGGGTLDCTVVDMFDNRIAGLEGDLWLGGDDFDARIVERIAQEVAAQGLETSRDEGIRLKMKAKAELAKINLSEAPSTQVEFNHTVKGKAYAVDFRLTRKDYNQMISDLVGRAVQLALRAVEKAKMTPDEIDVVLLVGGSTLTPCVQEQLEQAFGNKLAKRVDPMLAVALGAAKCTRDLGIVAGEHCIRLRSLAEVWSNPSYSITGRTTPQSQVAVTGGAAPVDTVAGGDGLFAADIPLLPSATNDLVVISTSPTGGVSRVMHRIRHDERANQRVEAEPRLPMAAQLPRGFYVGVISTDVGGGPGDFLIAKIVEGERPLPLIGQNDDFGCRPNPSPVEIQIPVYQGYDSKKEIPVGDFNTELGTLKINCPALPNGARVVVAFEVDESQTLTLRCWLKDDPTVTNSIRLERKEMSRDKMHLIERTERLMNEVSKRLRPDELQRINRKKQALIDLSEGYWVKPSEQTFKQILQVGNELKTELMQVEKRYNV